MATHAGILPVSRDLGDEAEGVARMVLTDHAIRAGCDMSTFALSEMLPSTIGGLTLEGEDMPFPPSQYHYFRYQAELA